MPYYTGDWYRGDYYKGDPGFWSTLGSIGKAAAGFIPGVGPLISGGISAVESLTAKKAAPIAAAATAGALTKPGFYSGATTAIGKAKSTLIGTVKAHPVLTAAGAAGLAGAAAGVAGTRAVMHMGGGKRRRRMRVTNPKALRRAIRRATGFARLAKKVLSFTERRPHRGRGVFKARRRAKRVC
jgi:hypothetical protein